MSTTTEETAEETPPETPAAVIPLTLSDRCDSCGSQAFVRVTFTNGPLLLCGHDFAKNELRIMADAPYVVIQDERNRINNRPSPSANI